MSQASVVINDGTGAQVLSDLNDALAALITQNSGAGDPVHTFPFMFKADSGAGILRQRNAANTGWITRGPLAEKLVQTRSSNSMLTLADCGCSILASGSFNQTLAAVDTLGDGWYIRYANTGNGPITLTAQMGDQIDDTDSITLAPREACLLMCDGRALYSQGRIANSLQQQNNTAFTSSGNAPDFILEPSPPLKSLVNASRFRIKFHTNTSNATNTLRVSGLPAQAIKQYDARGNKVEGKIAAGQLADVEFDGTDWVILAPLPPTINPWKIQSISASTANNVLTLGMAAATLDFRSPVLSNGVSVARSFSDLSLSIPAGASLGTSSNQAARLILLAIDNAGTVELAVCNLAGGINLDETSLISTTAMSASATAANVIYSATARTNVPFRVVGFIDSTQATAGTWATTPSKVQGCGGQALAAMSSLGYGQAWTDVKASRASGTTYYNTTGKPISVSMQLTNSSGTSNGAFFSITVDGIVITGGFAVSNSSACSFSFPVPQGKSYMLTANGASFVITVWSELR